MTKYLHIANPDKFTVPLCNFINANNELENHKFLFISNQIKIDNVPTGTVYYLYSPLRESRIKNLALFYKLCYSSDVIIMHGSSAAFFFKIFPWFTKKMVWVINGAELYGLNRITNQWNIFSFITSTKFTLKRAKKHLTHIEGDSHIANKTLGIKAAFHYSPIYLSNVVSTDNFKPVALGDKIKILVGNSNSSNNDHITIFKELKKFEDCIDFILSPLSYGNDITYKENVKNEGFKLFGNKFIPIEDFMPIDNYKEMLSDIDVAVFNHWRQEAMGVTLTLLSLGKIVYVNPNTTSYESLKNRGFRIFDNNLLFTEGPSIQRDVFDNKHLLEKYYSKQVLIDSLKSLNI